MRCETQIETSVAGKVKGTDGGFFQISRLLRC